MKILNLFHKPNYSNFFDFQKNVPIQMYVKILNNSKGEDGRKIMYLNWGNGEDI